MSAEILEGKAPDAATFLGRKMHFWVEPASGKNGEVWEGEHPGVSGGLVFLHEVVVTEEMVAAVQSAVNFVKDIHAKRGGEMLIERSVSIGQFTGETGATGSADVIILVGDTIIVIDFKFGRHKVYASELMPDGTRRANLQMGSYAIGSKHDYEMFHTDVLKNVTMIIVQPFVNHVSEFSCTVEDLAKVEDFLRDAARRTREDPVYVPTFDNCHFCRSRGHCHAQRAEVFKAALDGFDEEVDVDPTLASQYSKVAFIRDWADAVEGRVMKDLTDGTPVEGYKLVEGKKGHRAWKDDDLIEQVMEKMRLKKEQRYNLKLKTPSDIDKSKDLGPTQKKRLLSHVIQPDGKPTIAPVGDPRPALSYADPFAS